MAVIIYWTSAWTYVKMMTPFRDQKPEILRESGTTQSHIGIDEGPLSTQHTGVSRFDLRRLTPSCFLTNSPPSSSQYIFTVAQVARPSLQGSLIVKDGR